MPPEVAGALLLLAIGTIYALKKIVDAVGNWFSAHIDKRTALIRIEIDQEKERVQKEKEQEEELRRERDLKRKVEIEELRQRADKTDTLIEYVGNLTVAVLDTTKQRQDDRKYFGEEFHKMLIGLSNHSESVGELAQRVNDIALIVDESTGRSRLVITAMEELKGVVTTGVDAIKKSVDAVITLLTPTLPTQIELTVKPSQPDAPPASDAEAA
jgi:methyl-accepting chemotaxis protein